MYPETLKTTLHIYGTDPYDHSRVAVESFSSDIRKSPGEMRDYQRHLDKIKLTGEYAYYYIYVCDPFTRTMDLVMYVDNPVKQRMELNLKAKKATTTAKRKAMSPYYVDPGFAYGLGNSNVTLSDPQEEPPQPSVNIQEQLNLITSQYEQALANSMASTAAALAAQAQNVATPMATTSTEF